MMYQVSPSRAPSSPVAPVEAEEFPALQAILEQNSSQDYFQSSMGYYAVTGRNGLWKAQRGDSLVLFCRHPNNPKIILVFPPVGSKGPELLYMVVQTLFKMGDEIQLARFENDSVIKTVSSHFIQMPEQALDWTFPIRTIDTAKVFGLSGNGLQHVRQKLNHLDKDLLKSEDLNVSNHKRAIEEILNKWASADKHGIYYSLLKFFDYLPLTGRIIFYDNQPAGFSIWEETSARKKVANAYANIGLYEMTGLSHFVIYDMCRKLQEKGFEKLCLGGSETEGLDQFKRKFCPVENAELFSFYDKRFMGDTRRAASA